MRIKRRLEERLTAGKGERETQEGGGEEVGKEGVHNREENSFLPGRIMVLYHLFSRSPGLCSCCPERGEKASWWGFSLQGGNTGISNMKQWGWIGVYNFLKK
jgi:hypothetical protein